MRVDESNGIWEQTVLLPLFRTTTPNIDFCLAVEISKQMHICGTPYIPSVILQECLRYNARKEDVSIPQIKSKGKFFG